MFFYELSHLDLYLFSFFMVMLITFVIWNITFVLGDTNSIYYHKPFNCGFDVNQDTQAMNINIRFFVVGLLFLIFDVELVLLLPVSLGASEMNGLGVSSFFVFFFLLTLLMVIETSKDFLSIL